MLQRSFHPHRLRTVGVAVMLVVTMTAPGTGHAGGVTGQATEWTQLLNNAELIALVGKSAEQVNNQIKQITQLAEQTSAERLVVEVWFCQVRATV